MRNIKKYVLLSAILTLTITCKLWAQNGTYTPFPSKAIWQEYEYQMGRDVTGNPRVVFYKTLGDTLIDGKVYTKLQRKEIRKDLTIYDSAYYGAFRQDIPNKKVYLRLKNWLTDSLLYDFNLKVGDKVKGWFIFRNFPKNREFNISKIGNGILADGRPYNYYVIDFTDLEPPYESNSIAIREGIGSQIGFIKALPLTLDVYYQLCISNFETKRDFSCESERILAIENSSEQKASIFIYPNPTNVLLGIQTSLHIAKLVIYQSNGTKVLESKATESLDVSALPEGLYLLEAIDVEGKRVVRKFEKR